MNKSIKQITPLIALASTLSLIGCGGDVETNTNTSAVDVTQPVSDWNMVWSDEFDGTSIDSTKWTHEVNCDGGGNNEQQCYTDTAENSFVTDGKLNIVALPAADDSDKPYTSARLITKFKGDFKYGRFEVSAKLPSGQGSWPAFWMLPTDEVYGGWPQSGEIDILESVNLKTVDADGNEEGSVHGTLHYGKPWPDNSSSGTSYTLPDGVNPADDFHTYAVEWQEGEIRWYVDDFLYATQRKSVVRTNSRDEAVGLSHRGWFIENFDNVSGELTTFWNNAPFDQRFFMILNFAVGGDWPENVNNLGIDTEAFANGQTFEIDYVRVYQCGQNPDTGKGCETVRPGYDSLEDALVEGAAPIPSPPSTGIAENLSIFSGALNPNWPAWDCCGGSTPTLITDAEIGDVIEFSVGETPTVNGFISRDEFITDELGSATPFDASPIVSSGTLTFDMKVVSAPNDASAEWFVKMESNGATTEADFVITESTEALAPVTGEWQTYTFSLQAFEDKGLDLSAIDVVMVFPTWGAGDGAVYQIANVNISTDLSLISSPELVIFEESENTSWPLWDCCGGSTPTVELDDDAHTNVSEFSIGSEPTVMGFISRDPNTTQPAPFDATGIITNGVIQFEMKVVNMPSDPTTDWIFKVETDNAASAFEVSLTTSVEATAPVQGEWQTYTFPIADLATAGFDLSAIDVLMIFPTWGEGEGSIYRVDNVKIYDPTAESNSGSFVLFDEQAKDMWSIWDCCGGSTPTLENDGTEHGMTAQFVIGSTPTVMGLLADDDVYLDATNLLATGVVKFDMKVITAPTDSSSTWVFKIESGDTTTAVELPLTDSLEGVSPTTGEWQTYTYTLQSLFDAGLDVSEIDVVMFFPAWATGEGAEYRIDNVLITNP